MARRRWDASPHQSAIRSIIEVVVECERCHRSARSVRRTFHSRPDELSSEVAAEVGVALDSIRWLPFFRVEDGEREHRALEFLPELTFEPLRPSWRDFWPQRGHQQSWDAIGTAGTDWLLVEAKANWPEFCTPPTTAKGDGLKTIENSLGRVRRDLGVSRWFRWTGTYYQYANRLATLWFLREHGVGARLVSVYFTGDRFPDRTPCPASEAEWLALIETRRLTLGLPKDHALSAFEHHVFLAALST
jgi:hypothetical protein